MTANETETRKKGDVSGTAPEIVSFAVGIHRALHYMGLLYWGPQ